MFRKTLFWLHLAAGLVAGVVIGVMCFTGVVLAFEKQLVAWSERDARRVEAPATGAPRLTFAELSERVRAFEPEARPQSLTISADPQAAVSFTLGRDNHVYANPFTGEIRRPVSTKVHDFMHVMEDWHRVLALGGDNRPIGKAINGACNFAFFFLAVTGLYLWWPRSLTWRSVKAVALFNWRLTGKPRDFNWHNSLGLWSAPILIVLTLTALPISYRWASNGIYHFTGETPPVPQGPGAAAPVASIPPFEIQPPSSDARPLSSEALLEIAQQTLPTWTTLTLRPITAPRRENGDRRGGPQPVTIIARTDDAMPRTAQTILTLHPFTGEILKREGYAELTAARQIRSWTRFLHTGEALGVIGQLVAGLASLAGCVLVYTGFALAWRRFFPGRIPPAGDR